VSRFKVGDAVFGATGLKEAGTLAEALVTEDKTVFLKPQSLSFEEAAALPIVSAAAWTALIDKAKLRSGQGVFITGCLGGAGRIAVQIAKIRGAEIAGSCSASRRDEALALGVREVVDYRAFDADTYRGRFDVVFDTHGALSLRQCGAMLKRGGVALYLVPTPLKMIWSMFSLRNKTIFAKVTPESLAWIAEAVEQGNVAPKIGRTVTLSEAIPAIIELEKTSLPSGKLVIIPNV
jgi:NADPH:quinone reductase-like Zn-dependent oxidoreductase